MSEINIKIPDWFLIIICIAIIINAVFSIIKTRYEIKILKAKQEISSPRSKP